MSNTRKAVLYTVLRAKKAGAHGKSNKAKRRQAKAQLRQEVEG